MHTIAGWSHSILVDPLMSRLNLPSASELVVVGEKDQ